MSKPMTQNEEIIYGEIYKMLGRYLSVDDETKNHITTEALATMVPVLDEMEKRLAKQMEKAAKSKAPAETKPATTIPVDTNTKLIIDIIKAVWKTNDSFIMTNHETEAKYHADILNNAATHLDRWSASTAWLNNEKDFFKINLANSRLSFIKWVLTHFPQPDIVAELLNLIKDIEK